MGKLKKVISLKWKIKGIHQKGTGKRRWIEVG
jgi:hypothetical protein